MPPKKIIDPNTPPPQTDFSAIRATIPLPAVLMGLGLLATPPSVLANPTDDNYSTPFNTTLSGVNILANDTFPPNTTAAVTFFSHTSHGTNNVANNGALVYTPNPGFVGADSFIYRNSDGSGVPANVFITVGASQPIPAIEPAGLALLSAALAAAAALRRRKPDPS